MKRIILIYSIMMLAAASCTQKMPMPDSYGALALTVSSDVKVEVQTKAESLYDDYNIYITGTRTGNDPYTRTLVYGEAEWPLTLPYGLYRIEAESCTEQQAQISNDGYGCVRYRGIAQDVQVMTPTTAPTPVSVACTMANAKVSISFDEGFLEDFEDVRVEMAIAERTVAVTSSEAVSVKTYFNVDQNTGSVMTYTVYGSIDDVSLQYTSEILLRPAKHAHLTFKSNHNGVLGPQISVDKEIGTNEIEGAVVPGTGSEIVGGDIEKPVIYVDYVIKEAKEVITIIDVIDKEDMTI